MSTIGFRIFTRIHRTPKALVEQFRGLPVANIADEMGRMFCLDARIRPMNSAPLLGVAFTVRARPGDNLMLHRAIDMAEPGDVILIEDQGDLTNAMSGENMMMWAARRGRGATATSCSPRHARSSPRNRPPAKRSTEVRGIGRPIPPSGFARWAARSSTRRTGIEHGLRQRAAET